jgi:hypothetical protein
MHYAPLNELVARNAVFTTTALHIHHPREGVWI